MLATIVVLRVGKMMGVISFPDLDLSIPRKVGSLMSKVLYDGKYLVFLPSLYVNTYPCVFPDVSTASPLCWESSIGAFWDPTTQVCAHCFISFRKLFLECIQTFFPPNMKWHAQTLVSQLAHVYCAAAIQHFPHHGVRRSAAEVGETSRFLSAVELRRRRRPGLRISSHLLLLTGRPSPRPLSWLSSPWSSAHLSRPGNTSCPLSCSQALGTARIRWHQSGTLPCSCPASHSVIVSFCYFAPFLRPAVTTWRSTWRDTSS